MDKQKTYYITTPIYYPSSKLHIGHTYTTVAGDVMARYKRLRGYDVMYLTGTDEHGQKIQRKAEQMGKTPIEFVDEIVAGIKELWSKLDISYDDYIRTTEDRHKKVVQKIFQRFLDQGDIYLGEYEGFYCVDCEAFFTDRQLKDGNCPDCGRPVNKIREKSYFFRMNKYADRLVQYYEEHPEFIEPVSRKNEMIQNFIKPGLEDLCISRSTFSWGIPLPNDLEQVMYVWLDALSNYITAIGYEADEESLRHKFANYWPADVHLIGKDIVRFHSIYWPIFLMALDLPLPKKVFAHGFFLVNGDKMSKSKGNVIDPVSLIDRYGLDAYRYFLLREVPFGQDGVFTPEAFVERVNADLANDLGNLLHRTLTMVEKYFDGVIPTYVEGATPYDAELQALVHQVVTRFENAMENLQFSVALSAVWEVVRAGNKYIENNAPWNLAKDPANHAVLGSVLYSLLEVVRIVSVCIQPFLVKTPLLIWEQIGIQTEEEKKWDSIYQFGALCSGVPIYKQNPIFPRLDGKVEVEAIVQMMKDTAAQHKGIDQAESGAGTKQEVVEVQVQDDFISIDEFMKVELKVGEILEAEPVKGANRLLKLQLDLGTQKRQVVSGIAEFYQPQEIVGTKVIVVTNLKPVKLRGEQSEGMILAAKEGEKLVLSTVSADIPNGTRVK